MSALLCSALKARNVTDPFSETSQLFSASRTSARVSCLILSYFILIIMHKEVRFVRGGFGGVVVMQKRKRVEFWGRERERGKGGKGVDSGGGV